MISVCSNVFIFFLTGFPVSGSFTSTIVFLKCLSHPRYNPGSSIPSRMIPEFSIFFHPFSRCLLGPLNIKSSTYTVNIRSNSGSLYRELHSGTGSKPTDFKRSSACFSQYRPAFGCLSRESRGLAPGVPVLL